MLLRGALCWVTRRCRCVWDYPGAWRAWRALKQAMPTSSLHPYAIVAGHSLLGTHSLGVCTRQANEVLLEGRPALGYDVLSLDVGITPSGQGVPGALEHTTPVKPVSTCGPLRLKAHSAAAVC